MPKITATACLSCSVAMPSEAPVETKSQTRAASSSDSAGHCEQEAAQAARVVGAERVREHARPLRTRGVLRVDGDLPDAPVADADQRRGQHGRDERERRGDLEVADGGEDVLLARGATARRRSAARSRPAVPARRSERRARARASGVRVGTVKRRRVALGGAPPAASASAQADAGAGHAGEGRVARAAGDLRVAETGGQTAEEAETGDAGASTRDEPRGQEPDGRAHRETDGKRVALLVREVECRVSRAGARAPARPRSRHLPRRCAGGSGRRHAPGRGR